MLITCNGPGAQIVFSMAFDRVSPSPRPRVQGRGDQPAPRSEDDKARIAACDALAADLETEFVQPGMQRPLELVMSKAKELGPERWPLELLKMPPKESEPFFDAMRVRTCSKRSMVPSLAIHLAHGLPAARSVSVRECSLCGEVPLVSVT